MLIREGKRFVCTDCGYYRSLFWRIALQLIHLKKKKIDFGCTDWNLKELIPNANVSTEMGHPFHCEAKSTFSSVVAAVHYYAANALIIDDGKKGMLKVKTYLFNKGWIQTVNTTSISGNLKIKAPTFG